ncbi:MAG: hypothetical protein HWQ35_00560 [Nostoc sp. NMS1]|uniref:hypothetical protein n=1 Tax=unclassified Nostoc TaxID=2593658 RepID=UPI0025D2268B|nr:MULTISPECIES: hypothetical protein [unclassified Nostoc]MBN3905117.1 hypothetical protein [Nostoc sp. NMS1]MBN3989221.1 hypothetical protein [Nostoc sp. NMS2]
MEIIETYKDGHLIDSKEVNTVSSPNISGFIAQMLQNRSYNQMILAKTEQSIKNRLEVAVVRLEMKSDISNEDWQFFKLLWDSVIDGNPDGLLTFDDLIEWKQIAEFNDMPWTLDDDFKIHFR